MYPLQAPCSFRVRQAGALLSELLVQDARGCPQAMLGALQPDGVLVCVHARTHTHTHTPPHTQMHSCSTEVMHRDW